MCHNRDLPVDFISTLYTSVYSVSLCISPCILCLQLYLQPCVQFGEYSVYSCVYGSIDTLQQLGSVLYTYGYFAVT
jgi:hypothetical protein